MPPYTQPGSLGDLGTPHQGADIHVDPDVQQIEQLAKRMVLDNPGMTREEAFPLAQQQIQQRFNIAPGTVHGEGADSTPAKVIDYQRLPNKFPVPHMPGVGAPAVPDRIQGAPEGFAPAAADELLEDHPTYRNIKRNDPRWSSTKVAENPKPQSENITAPEEVDTLRKERI